METTIEEMTCGKEAAVVRVNGGFRLQEKLCCLNIREGKIKKKIAQHPLRGPVIMEIDGRQCAIGRGMAKKIIVEER